MDSADRVADRMCNRLELYESPFTLTFCQIILQQVDIFLHEFLKYWLLIKVGPGTVGDIDNVCHCYATLFWSLFPRQQRMPKRNVIFT